MPKSSDSNVVVLTGAGLSAESGIATFRDQGGLWSKVDVRDVATPEGFRENPERVHAFYNERRRASLGVRPNAAHLALARLEQQMRARALGKLLIVTQNVDPLHERAGSGDLIHMHGELQSALCAKCQKSVSWQEDLNALSVCPNCGKAGAMRPDVVWFGEIPYQLERIGKAVRSCDLFLSIGTSGNVYPAAGLVSEARAVGAHCVELNLEPSEGASQFHECIHGPATEVVPAYVERLLAAGVSPVDSRRR